MPISSSDSGFTKRLHCSTRFCARRAASDLRSPLAEPILLAATLPCEYQEPSGYRVRYASPRGTLHVPAGPGPHAHRTGE
jgi:hypothetical protein